jgi:hypothetical protein
MIKKWSEYITESFEKVSHTEDDIYKYTLDLLEDKINDLFFDIHGEFDTVSGDITPGQSFELGDLQEKMAKLISKQVHQNLGKDFKKIRSSEIDVNELKELSDERDSVKDGDEVIAVYFDGGYSIYKFKVFTDDVANRGLGGDDVDEGNWYELEDAYLVVKADTYNDFVSPDKRI